MRYAVDLRHPLQAPCGGYDFQLRGYEENYLVVEAVGMWESRRDFQRVWEGWEAGSLAFHAFHTLSFPWPAFRMGDAGFTATSTSAMGRTRKEVFVVIVVDACIGDYASVGAALMRSAFPRYFAWSLANSD